MKKLLLVTAIAGGMFAGVAAPTEAAARDRFAFSFDTGNVAFAYSDGYWDRDRRWHRWRDGERRHYRERYAHNYWDHPRSRARNMGWRDFDRDGVPNRYDDHPRNPYRD